MEIVGVCANGEQLRFERWTYEAYMQGRVTDPLLLACLQRVVRWLPVYW
jgi:hypothetical protein